MPIARGYYTIEKWSDGLIVVSRGQTAIFAQGVIASSISDNAPAPAKIVVWPRETRLIGSV